MNDEAFDYLLKTAWDKKIGYELTKQLSPEAPSSAFPEDKLIIINMNWHNKRELPFQLAHEITHVVNGDDTQARLYYSTTYKSKFSVEYQANKGGIELLIPFNFEEVDPEAVDIDKFMDDFVIPQYMREDVIQEVKSYYKIG